MHKRVEKEVTYCDYCHAEDYVEPCLQCGKEACWQCRKKPEIGTVYNHAVNFSGSGDGFYCHLCDVELSESRTSDKHNAFTEIRRLRDEYVQWHRKFAERQDESESRLRVAKS